jgi:hypothetical protein
VSLRLTRGTRILIACSGSGGEIRGWGFARLGLLAKQHRPEPLEAESGFLQGEHEPKIPLKYLVQHAPIGSGQGIACEPCA